MVQRDIDTLFAVLFDILRTLRSIQTLLEDGDGAVEDPEGDDS